VELRASCDAANQEMALGLAIAPPLLMGTVLTISLSSLLVFNFIRQDCVTSGRVLSLRLQAYTRFPFLLKLLLAPASAHALSLSKFEIYKIILSRLLRYLVES
jgi:hypothetical protein